jgi:hypothetical protein
VYNSILLTICRYPATYFGDGLKQVISFAAHASSQASTCVSVRLDSQEKWDFENGVERPNRCRRSRCLRRLSVAVDFVKFVVSHSHSPQTVNVTMVTLNVSLHRTYTGTSLLSLVSLCLESTSARRLTRDLIYELRS